MLKIIIKTTVLCLFFCLHYVCGACATGLRDIEIEELPTLVSDCNSGSVNYRFKITNNTNKRVEALVRMVNYGKLLPLPVKVEKKIELAESESREESMAYPCVGLGGSGVNVGVSVFVEGNCVYESDIKSLSRFRYGKTFGILLDREISNLESRLIINRRLESITGYEAVTRYYESNLESMDTNWVAYSSYAVLIFYDHTLDKMTPSAFEAIYDYVRAGGNLFVLGDGCSRLNLSSYKLFDLLRGFKRKNSLILKEKSVDFGKIYVFQKDLFKVLQNKRKAKYEDDDFGFGNTKVSRNKSGLKQKESADENKGGFGKKSENGNQVFYDPYEITRIFRQISNDFKGSKRIGSYKENLATKNFRYDDILSEITSFFAVTIIIMTLLLGPVNFGILFHKNKKIWVYVTTPVIATCICICILTYYWFFIADTLWIYRNSITFLDEEKNSSVTYGALSIFSGKNRNGSLSFPLGTTLEIDTNFCNNQTIIPSIFLDNKLNLVENWVKTRIPLHLGVNSITRTRARIDIKEKSREEFEILNGLGADISEIYLCIKDRGIFFASNIDAGAIGTCKFKKNSAYNGVRKTVTHSNSRRGFDNKTQNEKSFSVDMLKPGEYLAYLKKDPFLAQGFDKEAKITELGCLVIGKMGRGSAK